MILTANLKKSSLNVLIVMFALLTCTIKAVYFYELPANIRPKSGMFGDCSNFIDNLDRQINEILGGKNEKAKVFERTLYPLF